MPRGTGTLDVLLWEWWEWVVGVAVVWMGWMVGRGECAVAGMCVFEMHAWLVS